MEAACVYLKLCKERKQTEAEAAATHTHTHGCTNTPTLTHAHPRAHPLRDGGILTLNKPKQDIGGAGSF